MLQRVASSAAYLLGERGVLRGHPSVRVFLLLLPATIAFIVWLFRPPAWPSSLAWRAPLEALPGDVSLPWFAQPCAASLADVTFLVMASSSPAGRALHAAQRAGWLADAPHVWAFSDEDSALTMTLPELRGRRAREDAQHRQLRGMQWLARQPGFKATPWFMLVDDDTWVNVPVLLRLMTQLQPLLLQAPPPRKGGGGSAGASGGGSAGASGGGSAGASGAGDGRASEAKVFAGYLYKNGVFNGGAGMLLSGAAFAELAPAVYTAPCPYTVANDITLHYCAQALGGFTFVHSPLFSFYPAFRVESFREFMDMATLHLVKDPALMTELARATADVCTSRAAGLCCA